MNIKAIKILTLKELRVLFSSPLSYVIAGLFSALTGWLFFNYLVSSKELTTLSLSRGVFLPLMGNMNFIFIFIAPILTMRLFSEEKKLKTLNLLLVSDLTHLDIIIAKFLSSFVLSLFIISLTLVFPIVLSFSGFTDWSTIISSYIGLSFCVMGYLSVGIFASSLSENQIISALISFCLLFLIVLLVLTANATDNFIVAQIFQYLSLPAHFEGFTRGVMKSFSFMYFFSFTSFFFYLTHLSLESRKW